MQFEAVAKSFARKNLPGSEAELAGEVPASDIAPYRERALKNVSAELELPGFRKGKVPPEMALKKVGELRILEEAVNLFVRDFYPELVEIQKIDAVGRPTVAITKLAPQNPVGLTIRTAVYPHLELPYNWKELGQRVPLEPVAQVTDEEVAGTLESLRQARKKDDKIPDLNDEFAKSVGAFENLEALKEQIKKGIGEEKKRLSREKRRGAIIEQFLEKTKVEVPAVFVESELEKILAQLKEDVTRFGLTYEGYLKQNQKTEGELRTDFRLQAQKRAKLQLILNKIADTEGIEADTAAVEAEMKHALEHFPTANPELLGIHVTTVLRNEKILQLLEKTAEK